MRFLTYFLVVTCVSLAGVFLFGLLLGFWNPNHYYDPSDTSLIAFKYALDQAYLAVCLLAIPICWIALVIASVARLTEYFRAATLIKGRYVWTAFYSMVLVLLLCFFPFWMWPIYKPNPESFVDAMFAALYCTPTIMIVILHAVEQKRLARQLTKET